MIKTYLVPVTDEVIKAMEKGEAPSFLHCATCLDGLTNGEVHQKVFTSLKPKVGAKNLEVYFDSDAECVGCVDFAWWNAKWGE